MACRVCEKSFCHACFVEAQEEPDEMECMNELRAKMPWGKRPTVRYDSRGIRITSFHFLFMFWMGTRSVMKKAVVDL